MALAKKVKNVKFDAVFSSDLIRTTQTAEIMTLERKLAIKSTKALRERLFGKLESQPKEKLKILSEL